MKIHWKRFPWVTVLLTGCAIVLGVGFNFLLQVFLPSYKNSIVTVSDIPAINQLLYVEDTDELIIFPWDQFDIKSGLTLEEFYTEYAALIDDLRKILPGIQIYVQTLIPVTVSRAAARTPSNALLASRSELLARLAQEKKVYLVAVGAGFTEANGALAPDLTYGGLHLTAQGNQRWFDYLRSHTMGT